MKSVQHNLQSILQIKMALNTTRIEGGKEKKIFFPITSESLFATIYEIASNLKNRYRFISAFFGKVSVTPKSFNLLKTINFRIIVFMIYVISACLL